MAKDRFLIAPIKEGMRGDTKPWQIPEDSFERLENAYVYEGRVVKRFGSRYTGTGSASGFESVRSRLRIPLLSTRITLTGAGVGITDGAGAAAGTAPGGVYKIGQQFSIGAEIFTVTVIGTPGVMTTTGAATTHTYDTTTGAYVFAGAALTTQIYFYPYGVGTTNATGVATGVVPGDTYGVGQMFSIDEKFFTVQAMGTAPTPVDMLETGTGVYTTFTYDTTTGSFSFNGDDNVAQIYFYPSDPVMGLFNYETGNIHERPAIAADTQFIYQYNGTFWNAIGPITGGAYVPLTGGNDDFLHMTNWMGTQFYNTYLFVTNFIADDGMWYWDGATWTAWTPKFLAAGAADRNVVDTCRIILPFKDRLLLLNTVETDTGGTQRTYQNRVRFSHNGSPFTSVVGPPVEEAWYEINEVGYIGAGWLEAPTEEEIIGAEFIKDRLIVFFERSTWELAYTGNQARPFEWQKVNTELGSESPQSSVPFDKVILTVGTTGIHACNGSNVTRIDQEIPDEVFKIRNANSGAFRVAGKRDYIKELVYWTIPYISDGEFSETFPNKVLVYNYDDGTWALNDDCITAFGYFEQQVAITWQTALDSWEVALYNWTEGIISPQPVEIIAGNHQGFVFLVDTTRSFNESVMQISNITSIQPVVTLTIVNHNLRSNDVIKIEHCQGTIELNDNHYEVTAVDADTVTIFYDAAITAYEGLGVVARVSRIDILTKQFNPYVSKGMNLSVDKIEFAVRRTENGFLDIDSYTSSAGDNSGVVPDVQIGTSILETGPYALRPLEQIQSLLWHPVYFQSSGEFIQIRLYGSNENVLLDPDIADEGFSLEGMLLYTSPKGRLE